MAKKEQDIDLQGWITQVEYARKYGVKLSTVSRWVKRQKDGDARKINIQLLDVPALGITLVKPL
jgi:uncharacterized protein YjcR